MIKFKILRHYKYDQGFHDRNLIDNWERDVEESGDYHMNQDIKRFCMCNPDIEILDINLLLSNGQFFVIIKYKENNNE